MQCHEHIYLRRGPSFQVNPALCMDEYEKSLAELREYYAAGGRGIVDAQPGGFGRDAQVLRRLSQDSGVHIVAVTGFHKLEFSEPESGLTAMGVEALTKRFTAEITQGMFTPRGEQTDIRAGMVKAAFVQGALEDPEYAALMEAVARTAAATGAPVLIHTEPKTDILALVRYFAHFGVVPQRLLLCHLDRTNYDIPYHHTVLASGCYLCYDSVNRLKYLSHAMELELIRQICASGYEDRLVLSLDTTNKRLRHYAAEDMGLDYLLKDFFPMLRRAGFTEAQLRKFCVTNPAAILQMK